MLAGRKNFLPAPEPSVIQAMADVRNIARSRVYRSIGARMSKFFRKPEAILWILSISQASAMLAFNVLLRAAVS